jgi:hypothetical protein
MTGTEQKSTNPQENSQPDYETIPMECLVLHCLVCSKPVPANRARGRNKDSCGPEHAAILRRFKKWNIWARKCPTCYHPSTPEERKLYLQWRRSRGDLREGRGRPKKTPDALKALKLFILGFDSNDNIEMAGAADLARKVIEEMEGKKDAGNDQP